MLNCQMQVAKINGKVELLLSTSEGSVMLVFTPEEAIFFADKIKSAAMIGEAKNKSEAV